MTIPCSKELPQLSMAGFATAVHVIGLSSTTSWSHTHSGIVFHIADIPGTTEMYKITTHHITDNLFLRKTLLYLLLLVA